MKRALFATLAVAAIGLSAQCLAAGGADCDCPTCKPGLFHRSAGFFPFKKCHGCGKMCGPFHKCGLLHRGRALDDPNAYGSGGGPLTGQVTYPYYTVRGPRDFLEPVIGQHPRGIGP
ncbi:MAG TPA: hypothetical protein VG125_20630 [Pirellulales bacterium]|jgi:hypothetical protein|nr:hypothetical protein [Pirellulales bacterium]